VYFLETNGLIKKDIYQNTKRPNSYAWMTSGSLGIDGLSQSSSGPGAAIFQGRVGELLTLQGKLIAKFRRYCGLAVVCGSV
jgi:hypothetical protein